jgi:hypothetical protein
MVETVCSKRKRITVGREELPAELVKSRMLKLDERHIEYVMDSMQKNTAKVRNIRAYLLTALYRSPSTFSASITAEVNYDLYGRRRE